MGIIENALHRTSAEFTKKLQLSTPGEYPEAWVEYAGLSTTMKGDVKVQIKFNVTVGGTQFEKWLSLYPESGYVGPKEFARYLKEMGAPDVDTYEELIVWLQEHRKYTITVDEDGSRISNVVTSEIPAVLPEGEFAEVSFADSSAVQFSDALDLPF